MLRREAWEARAQGDEAREKVQVAAHKDQRVQLLSFEGDACAIPEPAMHR
jgi:hypothetical protein